MQKSYLKHLFMLAINKRKLIKMGGLKGEIKNFIGVDLKVVDDNGFTINITEMEFLNQCNISGKILKDNLGTYGQSPALIAKKKAIDKTNLILLVYIESANCKNNLFV